VAKSASAWQGYPPGNLARALPELHVPAPDWESLRHLAQRACPRCTARHQGGPVRRLFAHHEYLCARHGYWIGPPDPSHDDPPRPLALHLPELAAAQRVLRRTWRLHGWAVTFDARHALGYAEPANRHDISDVLSLWATARQAGRVLRPASAYTHAGHRYDGTPRISDGRLTAEQRTATRFRRDRRAPLIPSPGPPMPYACRPVMPSSAMSISRHRS
jgi:hypothetical protein